MSLLGPNDLKQFALPAAWDAAYLTKLALAEGTTYEELLTDITSALSMQNAALMNDPLLGSLCSVTTDASMEYRVGVSNGFEDHTEYGRPDAKRAGTTGTMIPLYEKDRGLEFTWDFLKKARRVQIDANIGSAMQDLTNLYGKMALERLFKSTYTTVGSSGKAVPVADGGTADAAYVPWNDPARAAAFAYTHTHLLRQNGITQATLETAIAHLWEHGYDAPFTLLISQTDTASWANTTNVTGYVKKANTLIRYGTQTDLATVDQQYIAAIETSAYGDVQVIASARIPTNYWAVYKSYGMRDPRNPLVLRVNPKYGIGAVMLAGDHIRQFPFENAILYAELGFGVADRVGAAVVYNHDDNAFVDPVIL